MSRSINFVRERRKQLKYLSERDNVTLTRVMIVFSLVVLVCIGLIGANWWFNRSLNTIVQRQETTRQSIAALSARELEYNIFVEKLQVLGRLFRQRQGKKDALSFFRGLFSSDQVKISGLEYNDVNQQLTFAIASTSVFSLDQVIDVLKSDEIKAKYPQVEKQGIKRDAGGGYTVEVIVDLGFIADEAEQAKDTQ